MAAPRVEGTGRDLPGGNSGRKLIGDDNEAQVIGRLGEPRKLVSPEVGDTNRQFSSTLCVTCKCEIEAPLTDKETDGQLLGKIKAFQDQREEERKRMFHVMSWLAFRLFAFAAFTIAVGHALRYFHPESHVPGALTILGSSILMLALLFGSCIPYDLLDIDALYRNSPKSMGTVIFFSCIVNLLQVRYFPHLDAMKLFCMLLMSAAVFLLACGLPLPRWWPPFTAALSWYLILDGLSWACIFFFYEKNDWLAISGTPSRVLGCINLAYSCTAFAGWFWHRWRYADLEHGHSRRYYKILYYWSVVFGIRWGFYGIAWIASPREGSEDAVAGALELVRGLCTMLPAIAVMLVGRDRFFQTLGQTFDRDGARLRRDGAFVAELLESIPIQIGQTWWIHRDTEDETYPPFDTRRCWQRGVVTRMANQRVFSVRLQEPRQSGSRTSMQRTSMRGTIMSDSSNDAATVQVSLPTAVKNESKEDLLLRAQEDLRCVEFENLSPELMYRVDSRNNPELQAAWHSLSRPVHPGERIDYFMSNSWYDDPETKWARLVEVAERFRRRHGRYPTFWLDKLCIDQQQITDGLKVLPVNVMACTKLLALCGHTYTSRLWCIWELFTLFAFVSEVTALNRIEFAFLGTFEEGMTMLDGMANFHVNTAHCYDPNEEARLLQVIDAVGTARFNTRVANMAKMTKARLMGQSGGGGAGKATTSERAGSEHSRALDTAVASHAVPDATDGVHV